MGVQISDNIRCVQHSHIFNFCILSSLCNKCSIFESSFCMISCSPHLSNITIAESHKVIKLTYYICAFIYIRLQFKIPLSINPLLRLNFSFYTSRRELYPTRNYQKSGTLWIGYSFSIHYSYFALISGRYHIVCRPYHNLQMCERRLVDIFF